MIKINLQIALSQTPMLHWPVDKTGEQVHVGGRSVTNFYPNDPKFAGNALYMYIKPSAHRERGIESMLASLTSRPEQAFWATWGVQLSWRLFLAEL